MLERLLKRIPLIFIQLLIFLNCFFVIKCQSEINHRSVNELAVDLDWGLCTILEARKDMIHFTLLRHFHFLELVEFLVYMSSHYVLFLGMMHAHLYVVLTGVWYLQVQIWRQGYRGKLQVVRTFKTKQKQENNALPNMGFSGIKTHNQFFLSH